MALQNVDYKRLNLMNNNMSHVYLNYNQPSTIYWSIIAVSCAIIIAAVVIRNEMIKMVKMQQN